MKLTHQIRAPRPGTPWDDVALFTDRYAKEIDGYRVAEIAGKSPQQFLEGYEADFQRDGSLPDSRETLLALIYLACRRVRWLEYGNADELIKAVRPFLDAILSRLESID